MSSLIFKYTSLSGVVLLSLLFYKCSNPQYTSIVVHKDHGNFFIAFGIPDFSKLQVKRGVVLANLDSDNMFVTSSKLVTTFYGIYNGNTREYYDEKEFKDTLQKCFSKIDSSTTHDSAGFFYYIHGMITFRYHHINDPEIQDSIKKSNIWAAQMAKKLRSYMMKQN